MSKSKNNFRSDAVKQKSQYKLWVCYKLGLIPKGLKEKMTYYSYNTKKDGGLRGLKQIVDNRKDIIKMAILYDNSENKELMRWDFSKTYA